MVAARRCERCGQTGRVGRLWNRRTCPACNGRGYVIPSESPSLPSWPPPPPCKTLGEVVTPTDDDNSREEYRALGLGGGLSQREIEAAWKRFLSKHIDPSRVFRLAMHVDGAEATTPEQEHLRTCRSCQRAFFGYQESSRPMPRAEPSEGPVDAEYVGVDLARPGTEGTTEIVLWWDGIAERENEGGDDDT